MNRNGLKENHIYYNKDTDTWLLIEKWGNKSDGFELCVETFTRKEPINFKLGFRDKGIIAYEATDTLPPVTEIDNTLLKGFVDRGLLGNVAYLTTRYGGGGNTEVDLVVPRYKELLSELKKVKTIAQFSKLAYIYDDVIYSPKGVKI